MKINLLWDVKNNCIHDLGSANPFTIGRNECHASFPEDGRISGQHLEISQNQNGDWEIVDLDSTNGTTLNSGDLDPGVKDRLISYSVICAGEQIFIFLDDQILKIKDRLDLIKAVNTLDNKDEVSFHIKSKSIAFCKNTLPQIIKNKQLEDVNTKLKKGKDILKEKLAILDGEIEQINQQKEKNIEKLKKEFEQKVGLLEEKINQKIEMVEEKKLLVKEKLLPQLNELGEKKEKINGS